jgi:GT2 family glycosyltransferase
LALQANIGCGGRNQGVQSARGTFVVTIDNDIRFDSATELEKVAKAFGRLPDASGVVFKVLHDRTGQLHLRDWCHPRSYIDYACLEFETCYIPEGACAFRRADFLRVGGHYEPFWIGGEGWDLALRMLDSGMEIYYCPDIHVRHAMAHETRSERRPYYFLMRNRVWMAFKDYTGWRCWVFLAHGLAVNGFFSLRTGNLLDLFRGLKDGFRDASRIARTSISAKGWQRLKRITAHRAGWPTRLKTHWAQPEI